MFGMVGASIPENTQHAVSVSLPTWDANVGYEEGQEWVLSKMTTGYPRFFIHKSIDRLSKSILEAAYGRTDELCLLFPSYVTSNECKQYITQRSIGKNPASIRILKFTVLSSSSDTTEDQSATLPGLYVVLFEKDYFKVAKEFWQHSGEGISSRRAEYYQCYLDEGLLVESSKVSASNTVSKGHKRYSRVANDSAGHRPTSAHDRPDMSTFVEERFGRNLDSDFVDRAKLAVRRRIAKTLRSDVAITDVIKLSQEGCRDVDGFTEDDVFLYPCGMSSIFNAHKLMLAVLGPKKSVCYGFPYVDTLKILQRFGPGCYFYGHGSSTDLDDLEKVLRGGERVLALFCEFPSNPVLKSPDLLRIRSLAGEFDFAVVIDETIGNFLNVHVLPYADVVVSSLTKIFSGESNVMGGSMVLNPQGRYYEKLKTRSRLQYEDNVWGEDAIFLERNSRDFVSRIERINRNAEAVCEILLNHPIVKELYYPKFGSTKNFYDLCRCPEGGYGGLLSITFHNLNDASLFFDNLNTAKGPSLGTNFTLSSPYTLLAHYNELEWAAECGVESNLVRVSIGLEETNELVDVFREALEITSKNSTQAHP